MRRVIKIGGSLLLRDDLPSALQGWLVEQRPAENIVIVGGGELIDAIRRLDALRPSESSDVHWRCVRLLETTYRIACDWFPKWDHVDSFAAFQRGVNFGFSSGKPTLVEVSSFYRANGKHDLPLDWRTTTDAIAALLAIKSSADEVVLLKSCDVDTSRSIADLATAGIVDQAIPLISDQLKSVRIEKL